MIFFQLNNLSSIFLAFPQNRLTAFLLCLIAMLPKCVILLLMASATANFRKSLAAIFVTPRDASSGVFLIFLALYSATENLFFLKT